jgi:hypothetical protein
MKSFLLLFFTVFTFVTFSQEKSFVVNSTQTFEYVNNELFVDHSILFHLGSGNICPEYSYYSFDENSNDVNLNVAYSLIGNWPTNFCERLDTFVLQLPEGIFDVTVCVDIINTDINTQEPDTTNYSCDYYPSYLLDVNEVSNLEKSISIYPNPASTYFTILPNSNLEIIEVSLFDYFGRHIQRNIVDFTEIDVSILALGSYFLEIRTNKGLIVKKVMVN